MPRSSWERFCEIVIVSTGLPVYILQNKAQNLILLVEGGEGGVCVCVCVCEKYHYFSSSSQDEISKTHLYLKQMYLRRTQQFELESIQFWAAQQNNILDLLHKERLQK